MLPVTWSSSLCQPGASGSGLCATFFDERPAGVFTTESIVTGIADDRVVWDGPPLLSVRSCAETTSVPAKSDINRETDGRIMVWVVRGFGMPFKRHKKDQDFKALIDNGFTHPVSGVLHYYGSGLPRLGRSQFWDEVNSGMKSQPWIATGFMER